MITECSIKTKLHVAACNGANATDGTGTMRPWGFDGLALEQLNNPISSVECIPHTTTDDAVVAAWMASFVAAAAADGTAVHCCTARTIAGRRREVEPLMWRRSTPTARR